MCQIEAKVSYRLPLVGGFSDFPEFYRYREGETISCTIDKFVSICISENEFDGLDIKSKADLPWGIGLGSSGVYYSALVSALSRYKGRSLTNKNIAKLAYNLEIGIDESATGRQDSMACLYRGLIRINYLPDDTLIVRTISIPDEWRHLLNRRLLLFDTGSRRSARESIKDILTRADMPLVSEIAKLPRKLVHAWNKGDLDFLGSALNLQEEFRSQLSPSCNSAKTNRILKLARECGAGARLTGAGIGCLLCYCREEHQKALRDRLGLREFKFSIEW